MTLGICGNLMHILAVKGCTKLCEKVNQHQHKYASVLVIMYDEASEHTSLNLRLLNILVSCGFWICLPSFSTILFGHMLP